MRENADQNNSESGHFYTVLMWMFLLLQKQKQTSLLINGFYSPAPFLINGFHSPDRLDFDCKGDAILICISSLVIRQKHIRVRIRG